MLNTLWNFIEKISRNVVFALAGLVGITIEEDKWISFMQFVKFGLVGLSNTLLTYVVYVICVQIGIHYQISYFIGYVAGIVNAFYWNNKYVFKQEEGEERSLIKAFVKCVMSYAGGYFCSSILLFLWVTILHFPKVISPIISLLVTIPINFILNKKWAFKTES
ncbi:GtrA family protein [Candidatus Galacturonibacter soehngenii]|uniref:GtrA family protein n=1 Tax=Candidatus Galacturonatibacter soehngenii TaxID=2307010 RepID=A0A7V7UBY7_9FIRM|nr:GtrA family protein [Candidatus Galacturonibacter soehngenii]KAB1438270.1 GtrA family protein [Candidatus Galacturonibacter soehngenii]